MAYYSQPITVTAALTLDRDVHAGAIVNVNNTTGFAITLPSAVGKGDVYELFYIATVGSGSAVVQVTTTDIMQGVVHLTTDIAGTSMPTAATTDTITMNGTTTGGVKGTWLRFKDASAGIWLLDGGIVCTSTEATPFSAAVS
jgi:hypothetical protein